VERVGGERVASLACKVNFLALPRKDLKFEIKDQETTPKIKDSPLMILCIPLVAHIYLVRLSL
jgi:hypothetical protein